MTTALTLLEQRLAGSDGKQEMDALLEQLDAIAIRLQLELRAGLAPEAFAQWQSCWSAVSNAADALRTLQNK